MSLLEPNYPNKSSLYFMDGVVEYLRTYLGTNLSWLDYNYGEQFTFTQEVNGARVLVPNVYIGQDRYLQTTIDNKKQGTCFFIVGESSATNYRTNLVNFYETSVSIVFQANLSLIDGNIDEYFREELISEVIYHLRTPRGTYFQIDQLEVIRDLNDVFIEFGYDVREVYKYPMTAFRINLNILHQAECDEPTKKECDIILGSLDSETKNTCILPSYDFSDESVNENLTEDQKQDLSDLICTPVDAVKSKFGFFNLDTNDYNMSLGNNYNEIVTTDKWTVRAIFKRNELGDRQAIWSKFSTTIENGSFLCRFSSNNEIEFIVKKADLSGNNTVKTVNTFTDLGVYDVVVTRNGDPSTIKIYVNGVDEPTTNNGYDAFLNPNVTNAPFLVYAYPYQNRGLVGLGAEFSIGYFGIDQSLVTTLMNSGDLVSSKEYNKLWFSIYDFSNESYYNDGFILNDYLKNNKSQTLTEGIGSNQYFVSDEGILGSVNIDIGAGQSNLVGREDVSNLPTFFEGDYNVVNIFNGNSFDALNISEDNNNQLGQPASQYGFECTLRNLYSKYQLPVFMLKYGVGGTSLENDWSATGANYLQLETYLNNLKSNFNDLGITIKWRSFVWIQGEKDCKFNDMANNYQSNLEDLILRVQNLTSSDIKFIIWQLNLNAPQLNPTYLENLNTIRTAQNNVVNQDIEKRFLVNMDDATLKDTIHYDGDGYVLGGLRTIEFI